MSTLLMRLESHGAADPPERAPVSGSLAGIWVEALLQLLVLSSALLFAQLGWIRSRR
jgi:hypothetical protein